jgi:tetratricopeptide (TPR) repeat protein
MSTARITCAFLVVLGQLTLVPAAYPIDKNYGFSVSENVTTQQAALLEAKAKGLLYSDGDYDRALTAYRQILELKTHSLGRDDVALAATLMEIALCYRAQGDYTRADEAYERAVELQERALGQTHVDVGKTLQRYACLMRLAGRKDEADRLNSRATSILFGLHRGGPVTGKVIVGNRISVPQPKYPKYARKQRLEGTVVVNTVIAEDGKIVEACAVEGPPSLALASEIAALRALFTPTTLDGVRVKVSGAITYNFVAR